MIDFRYHLVSIVAVFLALAIGIVLGTTALREPVIDQLTSTTQELGHDNDQLRATVRTLEQQGKGNDEFVTSVTPQLVAGRLDGQRVVVVTAPGADESTRDALTETLREAGATVTGPLAIRSKYLADREKTVVDELATQLAPSTLTSDGGTAYQRAAAVLASAVVTDERSDAGREDATGDAILSGFSTGEYVSVSGNPGARATLAVVIAPSTPITGPGATEDNRALVALSRAMDEYGEGAVLVGPASSGAEGGLIHALRSAERAAETVSTVDAGDTAAGRVVAVLALQRELSQETGHYGTGTDADAFVPSPLPTPPGSER